MTLSLLQIAMMMFMDDEDDVYIEWFSSLSMRKYNIIDLLNFFL